MGFFCRIVSMKYRIWRSLRQIIESPLIKKAALPHTYNYWKLAISKAPLAHTPRYKARVFVFLVQAMLFLPIVWHGRKTTNTRSVISIVRSKATNIQPLWRAVCGAKWIETRGVVDGITCGRSGVKLML